MTRELVVSSNIAGIGYDAQTATLEVEFKNGNVWQYAPVSPSVHFELMNSGSIGKSFHVLIKSDPAIVATDVTLASEVA